MKILVVLALLLASASTQNISYLPTVMWHGMGDSCCNPVSLGRLQKIIEEELPGIYVYSIRIGNNIIADTENGFLGNVNEQVAEVCEIIKNDPLLQGGYNALGFSQGAQFLRALAQRCPIPVNNLIGLGGQHQGVFGLPSCTDFDNSTCEDLRAQLSTEAYQPSVQKREVQAQYWHDPLNEEWYRNASIFLAEINNENVVNQTYVNSMLKLANLVLVQFLNDSTVIPRESSWFGFYAPGQDRVLQTLQESSLFLEDRLGLKQLYDSDRIQFVGTLGDHLEFSNEWFIEEIVNKYLNTEV